MPAFMPIDKTSQFGPVFILGMPFLRYYKTTFVREREEAGSGSTDGTGDADSGVTVVGEADGRVKVNTGDADSGVTVVGKADGRVKVKMREMIGKPKGQMNYDK
jgi:hypothetical protein